MPRRKKSHEISYIEDPGQVKFFLRRPVHLYVPTAIKEGDYDPLFETTPPDQSLQLQWVYGYRGRDARNNLFTLGSGEVVYFTAGVAVVMDVEGRTQKHYTQHSDDIKCLAVHPDGETVATGQVKGRDDEIDAAHIRVWSSSSLETLHVFGMGELDRAVTCLSFSTADGGALLAATDDAPEPKLSVWEWADESKLAGVKCSGDPVLAVNFTPEETPRIITSGKNSIVFWTLSDGALKKRTGVFGSVPKPKYVTAVAFTADGETVSGDSNGNIIIWAKGGNEVERTVEGAHDGSVFFILASAEGGFLTCGKDRLIKQWDAEFNSTDVSVELSEDIGGVRALAEAGGRLVAGSIKNTLALGGFEEEFTVVTQGSLDELWALATHPSEGKFVSGSLDGSLVERDVESKAISWTTSFEAGVQSACYTPGGEAVVTGLANGEWKVVDASSQEVIFEGKDGDEPIQVVRFSPDGALLAVGSRDNNVYLYEVADEFKEFSQRGDCSGHSSFIRSLDFSSDGTFLRTNSGDYELLFWRTEDCSQETDSAELKDTEWATRTCLLCFENFGIWPEGVDGTDLNAVTGAHAKPLVVTADDFGKVKLFSAGCHFAYAANKPFPGHSSHVTAVAFTHDDSTVLSVGGNDCSVLQWAVQDE